MNMGKGVILTISVLLVVQQHAWASTMIDIINNNPKFSEAKRLAKMSDVMDSLDAQGHGGDVTFIIPSNEAFKEYEKKYPNRLEEMAKNPEDIETLLLFASTDFKLKKDKIMNGEFAERQAVYSLLSEAYSISKEGMLCVDDDFRAIPCGDLWNNNECCANLKLSDIIEADDGTVIQIDKVLLPQELITKYQNA